MKAKKIDDARTLLEVPNIGPQMARDLALLGIRHPRELTGRDPVELYERLCELTGVRHDPCVLDVFEAAVDFAAGAPPTPWWQYSLRRKARAR